MKMEMNERIARHWFSISVQISGSMRRFITITHFSKFCSRSMKIAHFFNGGETDNGTLSPVRDNRSVDDEVVPVVDEGTLVFLLPEPTVEMVGYTGAKTPYTRHKTALGKFRCCTFRMVLLRRHVRRFFDTSFKVRGLSRNAAQHAFCD